MINRAKSMCRHCVAYSGYGDTSRRRFSHNTARTGNVIRQFPETQTDPIPFLWPVSSCRFSPRSSNSSGRIAAFNWPSINLKRLAYFAWIPAFEPFKQNRSSPWCRKLLIMQHSATYYGTGDNRFRRHTDEGEARRWQRAAQADASPPPIC